MTIPVINWEALDRITNHKRELATEMLGMLAHELPERQQKIQAALDTQNWLELRENIHKLHGSTAYCGAERLRLLAHDFEAELKKKQTESAKQFVDKINHEISAFLEALKNDR